MFLWHTMLPEEHGSNPCPATNMKRSESDWVPTYFVFSAINEPKTMGTMA